MNSLARLTQETGGTGLGSTGDVGDTGTRCHPGFIQALLPHLSCFDVLQSRQMQEEVVLWEGCLSIGNAAVVTYEQDGTEL